MSNIKPSGTVTTTQVIREVFIPSPLSNDPNPTLSGELDANARNIKQVGNIEVKTINGKPLQTMFAVIKEEILGFVSRFYSENGHRHSIQDVEGLKEEMKSETTRAIEEMRSYGQGSFSSKDHTHDATEIEDLSALVKKTIEDGVVPKHDHKDIRSALEQLAQSIALTMPKEEAMKLLNGLELNDNAICGDIVSILIRLEDIDRAITRLTKEIKSVPTLSLQVVETSRELIKKVDSPVPYIVLDKLPKADEIKVCDAVGEDLTYEIIETPMGSILTFKKTTAPYQITFLKKNA